MFVLVIKVCEVAWFHEKSLKWACMRALEVMQIAIQGRAGLFFVRINVSAFLPWQSQPTVRNSLSSGLLFCMFLHSLQTLVQSLSKCTHAKICQIVFVFFYYLFRRHLLCLHWNTLNKPLDPSCVSCRPTLLSQNHQDKFLSIRFLLELDDCRTWSTEIST